MKTIISLKNYASLEELQIPLSGDSVSFGCIDKARGKHGELISSDTKIDCKDLATVAFAMSKKGFIPYSIYRPVTEVVDTSKVVIQTSDIDAIIKTLNSIEVALNVRPDKISTYTPVVYQDTDFNLVCEDEDLYMINIAPLWMSHVLRTSAFFTFLKSMLTNYKYGINYLLRDGLIYYLERHLLYNTDKPEFNVINRERILHLLKYPKRYSEFTIKSNDENYHKVRVNGFFTTLIFRTEAMPKMRA
jgi:hypothetical protein